MTGIPEPCLRDLNSNVGLDPVIAIFAPHDQADLGASACPNVILGSVATQTLHHPAEFGTPYTSG